MRVGWVLGGECCVRLLCDSVVWRLWSAVKRVLRIVSCVSLGVEL